LIEELVSRPAGVSLPPTDELRLEVEIASRGHASPTPMGRPANLVCPECHGALGEIEEGDDVRFRCHSGHAYSEDALAYFMAEDVARALASALRALQERAMFFSKMADTSREAQNHLLLKRYTDRADEITRQAKVIQELLVRQVRNAA
jgi:two-component system chemotaxis response regulator CheB